MTRQEKFKWLKEVYGLTCTEAGKVLNKRGKPIGSKNGKGYIVIHFFKDGKRSYIYAHQFIWWFFYNETPIMLDHIDCDRTNNALYNLRSVTSQQNTFNKKNTKGYHWCSRTKKFRAMICLDRITRHIGRYKTEEEARIAYLTEKNKLHTYDKKQHSPNGSR